MLTLPLPEGFSNLEDKRITKGVGWVQSYACCNTYSDRVWRLTVDFVSWSRLWYFAYWVCLGAAAAAVVVQKSLTFKTCLRWKTSRNCFWCWNEKQQLLLREELKKFGVSGSPGLVVMVETHVPKVMGSIPSTVYWMEIFSHFLLLKL